MMARGFKPVGWVAGVAAAALGCYMLSLNVASERKELAKLERSIVMAKRDIRTLQTELETRGRLQQLESWNANVLALSAPTTAQFLDNELTLARFDQREQTIEERSVVHMASAPAQQAPSVQQKVQAPVRYASAPVVEKPARPLVHQASMIVEEQVLPTTRPAAAPKPAEASAKPASVGKMSAPAPASATEKKVTQPIKTASVEKKPEAKKVKTVEKVAQAKSSKAEKTGSVNDR